VLDVAGVACCRLGARDQWLTSSRFFFLGFARRVLPLALATWFPGPHDARRCTEEAAGLEFQSRLLAPNARASTESGLVAT
jgi:hypothetical protein